jgi:D-3-phosphoglycerate dehydrogenase
LKKFYPTKVVSRSLKLTFATTNIKNYVFYEILLLDKNHPLITEQLLAKNCILEEDFTSSYDEVCA